MMCGADQMMCGGCKQEMDAIESAVNRACSDAFGMHTPVCEKCLVRDLVGLFGKNTPVPERMQAHE